MKNLVILISGRGSNLMSIVQAAREQRWPARIAAVVSNRDDAAGLRWAADQGIPAEVLSHRGFATREAFDAALSERIEALGADYVVLAGFMRILTPGFTQRHAGRLINIHPSLLPAFPGLDTHRRALAAGVRAHGASVHFVTAEVDHGPIIAQAVVPVLAGDDPETLGARVLRAEHRLYPMALRWLVEGRVRIADAAVVVDGVEPDAQLIVGEA